MPPAGWRPAPSRCPTRVAWVSAMEVRPIARMPTTALLKTEGRVTGIAARLFSSNRFVLGMALLLGVVLPEWLHPHVAWLGLWFAFTPGLEPSLLAAAAAILAAHLTLQQMGLLPLVTTRSLILPTFLVTFGAAALTLFAFRINASRYHIWTGFTLVLGWYFLVTVARGRLLKPHIGLFGVPHDFLGELPESIEWSVFEHPVHGEAIAAMVVDPHACFDVEASRFIARLVLEGIPVYHRSHIEEALTGRVRFSSHADNNFGALLPSLVYIKLKRLFDIGFALLLLPLTALILLVAAIAIRFDSPGPVIFRQIRTGYRGRPFTCYKLRSMHTGHKGPAYTLETDPRVTRVGRILRQWRIDELPQIINILKGDMSWIGPRPEAVALALEYGEHIPFYEYRHAVRPGLSGWAAVHQGNVGQVGAARMKLEYDFYYIKYFSIWLDVLITLKTCQTLWSGFGAR